MGLFSTKYVIASAGFESPHGCSYPSTPKWWLQSMNMGRRWRRGTRDAMMGLVFAYTKTTLKTGYASSHD